MGPWRVAATVGGLLVLGVGWVVSARSGEELEEARLVPRAEAGDGGTVAVGDSALTAPVFSVQEAPSVWLTIALEMPPKPFPGQRRPDANGRCPRKVQVPINGGCWVKLDVSLKDCEEDGYVYKGGCYAPAFPPARQPTSSPAARPDGG